MCQLNFQPDTVRYVQEHSKDDDDVSKGGVDAVLAALLDDPADQSAHEQGEPDGCLDDLEDKIEERFQFPAGEEDNFCEVEDDGYEADDEEKELISVRGIN